MNTETGLQDGTPVGESSPTRSLHRSSGSGEMPKTIGKYRIIGLLGRGGMGMVYEGRDDALDRSVAIKLITPELCLYPEVFERFRTEARAAARLNHPNIVNVYEFGGDAAEPYLVMEFVEGQDLSSLMKGKGALQPDEVIGIIRQSALALSKATAANLVHRDIKPSNILLTKDGVVKIMDFGLSKLLDSGTSLTSSGAMMGTPDYMSPEQASGTKLDYRTDMYSLGCTMYALLAGKKPYQSESLPGMINQHINTALPIPVAWRKIYNGRLVALMEKMCAKKRENRPYTWDEIVRELDSLQALAGTGASGSQALAAAEKGRRWPVGIIAGIAAGVLLTVVIGGSIAFTQMRGKGAAREDDSQLEPIRSAQEKVDIPGAVILQNTDQASREEPFILPAPARPDGDDDRRPRDRDDEEGGPAPGDGPRRNEDNGRPRRGEGGRPPQMSEEQMQDHRVARQQAITAMQKGDFQSARQILNDEVEGANGPPAPRPIQRVYESVLEIMDEIEGIDMQVKEKLKNPNATAAQRIEQVHKDITSAGVAMTSKEAWFTLLYLHLLRDPDVSSMFKKLETGRQNFGKDDRQLDTIKFIDNFFNPTVGFPPAGNNQQRPPQ